MSWRGPQQSWRVSYQLSNVDSRGPALKLASCLIQQHSCSLEAWQRVGHCCMVGLRKENTDSVTLERAKPALRVVA